MAGEYASTELALTSVAQPLLSMTGVVPASVPEPVPLVWV
jgi:hypothetical protein